MAVNNLQAYNNSNKEKEWVERIADCRSSGLSVRKWCEINGVSHHTYYKWQQRLYKKLSCDEENLIYEITPEIVNHSKPVATIRNGIISVDIYSCADKAAIATIISALNL